MTEQEAKLALARMAAAWPSFHMTTPTARLYLQRLYPWHAAWAEEAIAELEKNSARFPPISALVEAYEMVRRRRQPALPQTGLGTLTEQHRRVGLRSIEEARRALAKADRPPPIYDDGEPPAEATG